ncbi:hypothetical protein G6F63_016090 [Rhizopus arrhizus]|nr:hypothetical protein G6F63_016090 [Rhizopus arrhizus]
MAVCEGDTLHVLDINEAFAAVTGAEPEASVGQALTDLGLQPYEGRRQAGLPGVGRTGDDRRPAPPADRDAGHHRTQTLRDRTACRDRGGDAGHVLVQPRHHRKAGTTARARTRDPRRRGAGAVDHP